VLAEASYLVRKALGAPAEAALLRAAARGEFRLEPPTVVDLEFTVVRPNHATAFRLLP
jgi:hypothetical protein